MSNRKTILLLLLAIVGIVMANLALVRDGSRDADAARASLMDPAWTPCRILIERKGAPQTVLANAGEWRLAGPFAGSVDEQKVLRILDALAFSPIVDMMSDSELLRMGRTRKDFSLENPVVVVRMVKDSGEETVISLGVPTPSADGVYASVDGSSAVYVVPASVLAAVDVPADGFRRRSLFRLTPESVSSFAVRRGTRSVMEFSHGGDGWKVGDELAASSKVRQFLSGLTAVQARDFVWPAGGSNATEHVSSSLLAGYGLDPDSAVTVTLKAYDGTDSRISFGKQAESGLVYAFVPDDGVVVTVSADLRDAADQDVVMFTDSRLFPVEAKAVVSFSLMLGDCRYALVRNREGLWEIESPIVARADQTVVDQVLSRVLSLASADVVTDGGVTVSVSARADPVVVSRESVMGDLDFATLRSKEILRIDPALVKRVVRVQGGKATAVVYGRERRAWDVETADEGMTTDAKGIAELLSALDPLTADRIVKLKVSATELSECGLDVPHMTIAVDQVAEDAVRRNILIGCRTVGGRFATVGSADAVFVLPDQVMRHLDVPIVER